MIKQLEAWQTKLGQYIGDGFNYAKDPIVGRLNIKSVMQGLTFQYLAVASDGVTQNEEFSVLGLNAKGSLSLWVMSTNHPHIMEYVIADESNESRWRFTYGDLNNNQQFRAVLELQLNAQSISYENSWAMPDETMSVRFKTTMQIVKV